MKNEKLIFHAAHSHALIAPVITRESGEKKFKANLIFVMIIKLLFRSGVHGVNFYNVVVSGRTSQFFFTQTFPQEVLKSKVLRFTVTRVVF